MYLGHSVQLWGKTAEEQNVNFIRHLQSKKNKNIHLLRTVSSQGESSLMLTNMHWAHLTILLSKQQVTPLFSNWTKFSGHLVEMYKLLGSILAMQGRQTWKSYIQKWNLDINWITNWHCKVCTVTFSQILKKLTKF